LEKNKKIIIKNEIKPKIGDPRQFRLKTMTPQGFWRKFGHLPSSPGFSTVRLYVPDLIFGFFFQSWSALSFGASKIGGKVAEVGWKFTEVASQKVSEVSGVVSDKVSTLKTLVCFRNGNFQALFYTLLNGPGELIM
jgi:hypothetical protein